MTNPPSEAPPLTAVDALVPAESSSRPAMGLGAVLARAAPPLVTLVVALWGITSASYWRDEAATLVAVQRSFGQMLRMLGNIDAVHGVYYMLMWVLVRVGGTGELVTRLPSALAMAAAAALVAAIGRRLVSPSAGLAAGLVFAAVPATSYYGQSARPDAIAVAVAAGATYLLVRLLQDRAASVRWLAGYSACIAALGLIDYLALLLVAVHAVAVAAAALRAKDRAASRALAVRWLLAVLAALVVVSPLGWFAFGQRAAIAWVQPPGVGTLRTLAGLVSPIAHPRVIAWPPLLGLLLVGGCGFLVSRRNWLRGSPWTADFTVLSLTWLLLPAVIMWGASLAVPIFEVRYILFCLPALALLAGAGIASFGWEIGAASLLVVVLLGLPEQLAARLPDGHSKENIRRADRIVAANIQRGDAAIFHNGSVTPESWDYAYPYGFDQLRDISQARTPAQSGTLAGIPAPAAVVQQRLSGLSRVWVIDVVYKRHAPRLGDKDFQVVHRWQLNDIWLFLYVRRSGT